MAVQAFAEQEEEAAPSTDDEQAVAAAIDRLADRLGVSAGELVLLGKSHAHYPAINRKTLNIKVLHTGTGEVFGIALDAGGESDPATLETADLAATPLEQLKAGPMLIAWLRQAAPPDRVVVTIALDESAFADPVVEPLAGTVDEVGSGQKQLTADEVAALTRTRQTAMRQFAQELVDDFVATMAGQEILLAPGDVGHSATFEATLTAEEIRRLLNHPGVSLIDLVAVGDDDLDVSLGTTYSNYVHQRGYNGSGVRVAQIENKAKPYSHSSLTFTFVASSGLWDSTTEFVSFYAPQHRQLANPRDTLSV
jgi:hypothetical protein